MKTGSCEFVVKTHPSIYSVNTLFPHAPWPSCESLASSTMIGQALSEMECRFAAVNADHKRGSQPHSNRQLIRQHLTHYIHNIPPTHECILRYFDVKSTNWVHIIESIKVQLKGKSLKKFGRAILGRTSESTQSNPVTASSQKGKERSHDHGPPPPYQFADPPIDNDGPDMEPSMSVPDSFAKSLDPDWIDIEMIGYWLQKCDTEHGSDCQKPFGVDPSTLGRPELLIDVRKQ
jgi:hypothetical protein